MSWSAVDPGNNGSLGTFGYNVYIGSTLIGFTENTSYTYTLGNSSPYGTYRVVATYKGYSGLQGTAATYTLKEPEEEKPEEPTTPPDPYEQQKKECAEQGGTWNSADNTCTLPSSGGGSPTTP